MGQQRQTSDWPWLALGLVGAGILVAIALRYRVDTTRCAAWPPLGQGIEAGALYLVGLGLLSASWLELSRRAATPSGPSVRLVLGYATVLHAVLLVGLPFLSDDVLFYAGLGRVLNVAPPGTSAAVPLCQVLPEGSPFLRVLDAHWRCSTSSYLPGFHLLAWAVGKLGQAELARHLRLYQVVSAVAVLLTAAATAAALRGSGQRPAFGAAVVALSPLALIEGTLNAHNDVFLALSCALFVLALERRQSLATGAGLALGLTVKVSAALVAGVYGLSLLFRWLRWRGLPSLLGAGIVAGVALLAAAPTAVPGLSGLIGTPHAPWEYCTRSLECLPRALLRWELHAPTAAWLVGLTFRVLGGLWLLYVSWRGRERLLPWLATGLLVYYLYLHSWSQSWYFLSLLPLLPWAEGKTRRATCVVSVSACAYYAVMLVGNCAKDELAIALIDLVEGLIVVVPSTVVLCRRAPPPHSSVVHRPDSGYFPSLIGPRSSMPGT